MYKLWLSVFGAGFSPLIPGTCGSAVVVLVFLLIALAGGHPILLAAVMLVAAIHGAVVTVIYGDRAIAQYGKDPGMIVSDEQAGQAVTYLWLWTFTDGTWEIVTVALAGFVLFRIFDIIKPPPVRQLEKIPGAWGVLLDDIMAGIYASVVLQIVYHLGWLKELYA
jgi:phosphatidylglycerophosphatase A